MTTTPTSTTTPTTSTGTSSTQGVGALGSQQIAGNFNTFLQLLTTQLQNQDPLDPLDTNQFTQQLVEFAGVQQQIDTNQNMQTLITLQQTSEATAAMQFIGSTVTVTGNTATLSAGTPASWSISSPSPATGNITITNSSGQTVYNGTTPLNSGSNTYSWNGQGNNGITEPPGTYTLAVTGTGANGQSVAVTSQVSGTVTGVNLSQSPPQLLIGSQSYAISAIQSITGSSTSGISGLSSLNSSLSSLNTTLSNLTQLL